MPSITAGQEYRYDTDSSLHSRLDEERQRRTPYYMHEWYFARQVAHPELSKTAWQIQLADRNTRAMAIRQAFYNRAWQPLQALQAQYGASTGISLGDYARMAYRLLHYTDISNRSFQAQLQNGDSQALEIKAMYDHISS